MKYMPSNKGFLGIDKAEAQLIEKPKAEIIPFGLETSVSYGGGTAKGPQAMLKASHQVELFDDEFWCEPVRKYGVITAREPKVSRNLPKALSQLEKMVENALKAERFPLVFGGEHSITAAAIRPFAARFKDLVVLHLDAHADLRDGYQGQYFSHASAIRRVLDYKNIKVVSFGIRNISETEIPFLEKNRHRIKIFWAREKEQWHLKEALQWMKGKPVYITFDLDGFDASLMPATGTPEPGGLFWDDAMKIIREVAKVSRYVGGDINELAPKPTMHGCDFIAAKLAYKILNYTFMLSHRNLKRK
ncbi:MAG: agmatinase [Alphaproteobacteria bacterium]